MVAGWGEGGGGKARARAAYKSTFSKRQQFQLPPDSY